MEETLIEYAGDLIARARDKSVALYLPTDVMIASEFSDNPSQISTVDVDHVPDRYHIMDIGPLTLEGFSAHLSPCKTVIWNGPMGVFEYDKFAKGTTGLAKVLASLDATTIIGGGSTAEAVESLGLSDQMTHVSSGGGAMLEFLEGKELPGIAALPLKTPSAH